MPPRPWSTTAQNAHQTSCAHAACLGRQRAFRERKERHVKDLEERLDVVEDEQLMTKRENERLKRDLEQVTTENEILRTTSGIYGGGGGVGPGRLAGS